LEYYVRQCKKAWRLTYNCNHTSQCSFRNLKKKLNRRRNACVRMIRTFDTIPKRRKVIFIDERAIYQSCRSRSDVFWSRKNPHYFEKLEHKIPYFKLRCRMVGKQLFGRISLMILSIGTLIWTSRQTGSYRNWTAMVLKSYSKRRAVNQHIMHSLLGNNLVRFSGNVGMVVDHQCCPLHWPVHLDATTWHRVTIHFEAAWRRLLHRNTTITLKTLNKLWELLLYVSPHTFTGKCPPEYRAELFCVMRMVEHRENSWTLKACVVWRKCAKQ
jgi:hypothetical protein